jgi:hypothetical protein
MRKYLLAAVATLAIGGSASAQISCQRIGSGTICSGPNGYFAHGQRLGNGDFWSDDRGNSWNTQHYGSGTFTHVNPAPSDDDDD